jgi:ADP-heptose:LPS heptosyltransferase
VSHLAASVGAPTVALFFPENGGRWLPWARQARALIVHSGTPSRGEIEAVVAAAEALLRSDERATDAGTNA